MGLKKIHATTTHEFGLNACCATFKFNSKLGNPTSRNPTISNIICWVARSMGRSLHRPSVWCSKCYFFIISTKFFAKILLIVFTIIFFYNSTKKKINKEFWVQATVLFSIYQNTWTIRRSVDERIDPRDPAYLLKIVEFYALCP